MLIRIFSPTECGLIRDANLKKCGLNRMTTVADRQTSCAYSLLDIYKNLPTEHCYIIMQSCFSQGLLHFSFLFQLLV
jgi:hypothetical protein